MGICGYISKEKIKNSDIILSMAEMLTPQMSNNTGVYIHSNFALSCNTSSIFFSEYNKEKYAIAFNGQIYNKHDLENALTKKGYVFSVKTEAEVVLACYMLFGKEALNMIDGSFAFAILNEHKKELIIARDSLGLKPLFYSLNQRKVCLCFRN